MAVPSINSPMIVEIPSFCSLPKCHDSDSPDDFAQWNRLVCLVEQARESKDPAASLEVIIDHLWQNIPAQNEESFFNEQAIKDMENARIYGRNGFPY